MTKARSTTSTTSVSVSSPTRAMVLTRAQFGETDLPGSEYVRQTSKMYPGSDYSLVRLAVMGLLGAGAGAGIGRNMKGKHTGRGAIVGGLVGAASSLIYDTIHKTDEPAVVGAAAIPGGKGSMLLIGSSKGVSSIHPLLLTKGLTAKTPGWAGVIMAHGMLVQRCMMGYIYRHAQFRDPMHVHPYKGYKIPGGSSAGLMAVGSTITSVEPYNYDESSYWTNKFAEWPSPIFTNFGIGTPTTSVTVQKRVQDIYNMMVPASDGSFTRLSWEQGVQQAWMFYAKANPYHANNLPIVDAWWKENPTKTAEFQKRYGLAIQKAQWFVWATEMFRIHAGLPEKAFPGWKDHCAQWGVGCASDIRMISKVTMVSYTQPEWIKGRDGEIVPDSENPVRVHLGLAAVKKYVEMAMEITPPPFTTQAADQITIVPEGGIRWFTDMPDSSMGSFVPPMDLINHEWYSDLLDNFMAHGGQATKAIRWVIYIVQAVVDLVATYYGGPAGAIIGSFCSLCFTLARLGTTNQGKIAAGDIAKLIGNVVSAIADVADIEVASFGSFTNMLTQMQGAMDNAGLLSDLQNAISMMDNLSTNSKWPYVNELMSTINNVEQSLGENIEGALENV